MYRLWPLLLLLTAPLSLSGCARAPREAGVLRVAQTADVNTLDPALAYDTSCIPYVRLLYRGLVDYNQNAELVNEIATSRTVSPDGKTYRFKLRHDAYFQSGRPVVAEDFRYAIERVLDPATASDGLSMYTMIEGGDAWTATCTAAEKAHRALQGHISGIEVPQPDTIIFHLHKPDATFLNYLALPFAYAVPREWIESLKQKNLEFAEHPDPDGSFVLKEWVHNASLTLLKNPHYYRPGLPRCHEIQVQLDIDKTLAIMLFEQGSIDMIGLSDAYGPDFLRLTHDPKWKPYVLHAPMMDVRYLCLNTEMKPFNDRRVRQAMNYAIDRGRIAGFLNGRATLARGALPPGMPGYNPKLFQYPHDPGKARLLLKQAGFVDKPSNPMTLWYSTGEPWYAQAALSIQQDLRNVGMTVTCHALSYPELKAKAGTRGGAQISIMGWIQDFPDPADFLDVLFNGKSITASASINRAFYSNSQVNALLDQAGVEENRPRRLALYQQAEKLIVADAPWVFLHHTEDYDIRQPWIRGYKLNPMWSQTYE